MSASALIVKAEQIARTLRAATAAKRGARHSLYVVLLHNPRLPERWGVYVGKTSLDPDLRFDQHKAGCKASGAVRRFGVQLLLGVVEHLNPLSESESLDLKGALADAFRAGGIKLVEGGY